MHLYHSIVQFGTTEVKYFLSPIFLEIVNKVKSIEIQRARLALGLADYEAKAYVPLTEKGSLNAGDVSKRADVPRLCF